MATDQVWMSALRKGLAFHVVDGRSTPCGRYVSDTDQGEPIRGVALTAEEALAVGAKPCRLCHEPRDERQRPVVVAASTKGAHR